ncbi:RNA-directed DNA polymerase, eukaryota [Tanacetum coccineum]
MLKEPINNSSIPRGPNHSTPKETNMENSNNSFVSVLKRGSQSHVTPEITKPALVLDDTCIKEFDFGMSLMGRLSYLGGMWVLFEFDSLTAKEKFLNHSGIGSWFTELIQATSSFENDERIVWISIEGLPIKAWTPNTFRKIASLWGEYVEWEDDDLKSLSCKHLCLKTNMKVIINERQKVIIQGKVYWIRVKELDAWFPNFQEDDQDDLSSDGESQEGDVANKADNNESDVDRVSESSFMHENDTAHKDANIFQKREVGSHLEDLSTLLWAYWKTGTKEQRMYLIIGTHNMFVKEQVSTCDYFVALMGTWAPTSSKLLIISVYAPQELNERRDLWDYLRTIIDRWEGDTFMGFFFNSFVETTWKSLNIVEPNGLIRLKKKLQALKIAIKAWSKEANKRSNDRKINIQQNLSEVDKLIDQGKSNYEILIIRITLLNDLQELNNRNAMEISQKAKIRWSIEGDENTKYFHGIMNKKRSQLAIRGTLANGEWISEPHRLFHSPISDQVQDVERPVTYKRSKGCLGLWHNKSPGQNGISFEF